MDKRILLVGDYNRNDFIYPAKEFHNDISFFFIEYLNQDYLTNNECLKYGEVLYWKNFHDAYELIRKTKPQKIIFYFIESYNHVALNVAAKALQVPTYHLEHGLRFKTGIHYKRRSLFVKASDNIKKLVQLRHLYDRFANKKFFWNTVKNSQKEGKEFLHKYHSIRKRNSISTTFEKITDRLRLPDYYISYSPLIFNYHRETEKLPDHYPVNYIGIPSFDHFAKWKSFYSANKNILFIDQPFYEQRLLGWTIEYKKSFLTKLIEVARSLQKKLYIKPHPSNHKSIYENLSENVTLVEDRWDEVVPDISTVLGFSSTLLMPFMAMDHVTCFIMEMHPQKNVFNSAFLLQSQACHSTDSFEDLEEKLKKYGLWHQKQKEYKKHFIENWMYCFDGESSERLRKVLIKDETV